MPKSGSISSVIDLIELNWEDLRRHPRVTLNTMLPPRTARHFAEPRACSLGNFGRHSRYRFCFFALLRDKRMDVALSVSNFLQR